MDGNQSATVALGKSSIETLSREELLQKYKSLLGIAKKAKQAKDELTEENKKLKETIQGCETQKEADKKALLTMKEMLEQFTENKLELTNQTTELQRKNDFNEETIARINIENESLKRQLDRLTEDNESLLNDIDQMENQLKQVNLLGIEQKKHLSLLELEVNKLKESESLNANLKNELSVLLEENVSLKNEENTLKTALEELTEKYKNIKAINSEQRMKFNALKDRFVNIHNKLKKLKECKRVLLETQHEYSDSVSKWQNEIITASQLLCRQMNMLRQENMELMKNLDKQNLCSETFDSQQYNPSKKIDMLIEEAQSSNQFKVQIPQIENVTAEFILTRLKELQNVSQDVQKEYLEKCAQLDATQQENNCLKRDLDAVMSKESVNTIDTETSEQQNLEIKRLLQELKDLKIKLKDNDEILKTFKIDYDNAKLQLNQKDEHVNELQKEMENYKIINAQCEEKINEAKLLNEEYMIEKDHLLAKVQELTNELENMEKSVIAEKSALMQQIQKQEQEKRLLDNETVEAVNDELERYRANYEELQSRYEQKEREHADLLGEMRELNEALKARGDVISRQQEKQQELVAELKKTTSQQKQIENKLIEREQSITERDEKILEINKTLEVTRTEVKELEATLSQNEKQINMLNEELQSLRNAEPIGDCQSDILSTSTISRAEELNRLREVDESFEEKYNKLRGLAVKLKKKLQDQTLYVVELETERNELQMVKSELEQQKKSATDLEAEMTQTQKIIDSLKVENQKLKSSRKQANVLNLEIEAAEKSLNDATIKLTTKTNELEALNNVLITKENTIVQLRKEIALLESAKNAECLHSKELKEQIDHLQTQIKDAVHSKQSALVTNKELEHSYENLKLELEEIRLQMANSASKQEAAILTANADKDQLQAELIELEDKLQATQLSFKHAERELEQMRVEYLEYKLKAQAVLRKNQNKDTSKERELEEELLALRAVEKQQQMNAQMHIKKIEESNKKIEILNEDNDCLQNRIKELHNVIEELREQNETLANENRNQLHQQKDSFKNHRQQIENLDSCHKEQLKELENRYLQQIDLLKHEHAKEVRVPPIIGAATKISANFVEKQQNNFEQSKIEFLLMEREDAEGSEEAAALANTAANRKISNASSRSRSQHDFMPLDELLSVPMNAISDTVTTINLTGSDNTANIDTDNAHVELQATKERLQMQEIRIRHLTTLLAENEQDLAKLTQMNDMLKEELRRQERSVEREQHMHNSEYLKNVIIKFLTLNNGDERTRLVPVLNTILKLSRNETEMLNCVAKGQKVGADNNNRSWGSFLSWTGGNNNT